MIAAWETGFEVGRQARRQSAVASFALLVLLFFMGLGVGYIAWH